MTSNDWNKLASIVLDARKYGAEVDADKLLAGLHREAAKAADRERIAHHAEFFGPEKEKTP